MEYIKKSEFFDEQVVPRKFTFAPGIPRELRNANLAAEIEYSSELMLHDEENNSQTTGVFAICENFLLKQSPQDQPFEILGWMDVEFARLEKIEAQTSDAQDRPLKYWGFELSKNNQGV